MSAEFSGRAENPLTSREERIIEGNALDLGECPNPDCDLTPEVADVTSDGHLFVVHEEDGVGLDSRTKRGESDGCEIDPKHDPTL